MVRLAVLALFAACQSEVPVAVSPASPVSPVAVVADAGAAPIDALPPNTTVLSPVAMDGPYKTIAEACHHAAPCGFTDMDERDQPRTPATKTSCPALESDQFVDPNADDPRPNSGGINMKQLSHAAKDLELRIGSQRCSAPKGLRSEQDIYFMFVKRGDGWWRSAPLWQWAYNDKYAAGSMIVKWNDQPGRTFAGIAAGIGELVCMKQGTVVQTLELMVRVEPGTTTPTVFAPLVVGERTRREADADAHDCKPGHHTYELAEKWTGDDDLELAGVASWLAPVRDRDTGLLTIELSGEAKSTAGRYHFTR